MCSGGAYHPSDGVFLRPLLGDALRVDLVLLVVLRDVCRERVVRVRRAEQRLYGEQHRADLQRGRPLVLEDVEAYPAELVWESVRVGGRRQTTAICAKGGGRDAPMLGW